MKKLVVFGLGFIGVVGVAVFFAWARRSPVVIPPDLQAAMADLAPVRPIAPELIPAGNDWADQMTNLMEKHPDHREAMARFLGALEVLSQTPQVSELRPDIDRVIRNGWQAATPKLLQLIATVQPPMDSLLNAIGTQPLPLPPTPDFSTPVPNFLHAQLLFKVLLCRSQSVAAADPAQGADLALRVGTLFLSYCDKNQTLISHLIGIAGINSALRVAGDILRDRRITPEQARQIDQRLEQLERLWGGAGAAIRGEAQATLGFARRGLANISNLPDGERVSVQKYAAGRDFATLERDYDPAYRALIAYYSRPAHKRTSEQPPGLQAPFLLSTGSPNYFEAVTRMDTSLTRLRLCRALAQSRASAGGGDNTPLPEDPFSGKPLEQSSQAIWSIGPDKRSDTGQIVYDPTNGTVSPGDIVVLR